mmetsp:Transcript_9210/g.26781  ORF Transcript_9210/g.26781 Transcript_9210/m.26781 type:complete len:360 (+) Transcript_9210:81-1160(+)
MRHILDQADQPARTAADRPPPGLPRLASSGSCGVSCWMQGLLKMVRLYRSRQFEEFVLLQLRSCPRSPNDRDLYKCIQHFHSRVTCRSLLLERVHRPTAVLLVGTREEGHVRRGLPAEEALLPLGPRLLSEGEAPQGRLGLLLDLALVVRVVRPGHEEEARRLLVARVEPLGHLAVRINLIGGRGHARACVLKETFLDALELCGDGLCRSVHVPERQGQLGRVHPSRHFGLTRGNVPGSDVHAQGDALALPLKVLGARPQVAARVRVRAHAALPEGVAQLPGVGVHLGLVLRVLREEGHEYHLHGGDARREHQARVVRVHHDERPQEACGHTPARRPDQLPRALRWLELHVKSLGKVLP